METHIPRRKQAAMLEMLLCAGLWSLAGILIKLVPWHPMLIAGLRSLIAGTVVLCYMKARKWRFTLDRHTLLAGACLALTFCLFVIANKMTTAANAIVLEYTTPVFIVILSALLYRQKFSKADLVTVALTMGGISLVFLDQLGAGGMTGNWVALGSGLAQASTFIFIGKGCDDSARMSSIVIGHYLTALAGVPFAAAYPPQLTAVPVLCLLALGLFQHGIPYVLYGEATRECPPLMCSLIGAVEPLLNPLWVFLFDGERPGMWALAGGAIVIVTITSWCVYGARAPKEAEL